MYVASGITDESKLRALCEPAYNARAAVPEFPDILNRWEHDAAAWRDSAKGELDLPYLDEAGGGSARTRLDLFWPDGAESASCPIAMFIHGGYWQALDRKYFSHIARGPNAHGIALAVPSYDLCPKVDIATIERQMTAAVAFLFNSYGRQILVCGHSAGGHLTGAMLSFDFSGLDHALPQNLVPGGIAISGLFDLRDMMHSSVNDNLRLSEETARAASPLLRPAPAGKHVIACAGEAESEAFHWQSRELARQWGRAGNQCQYHIQRGRNHFTVLDDLADPDGSLAIELAAMAALVA